MMHPRLIGIEKKLLNKIEAMGNLIETANSKNIIPADNRLRPAYEVEEGKKKYGSKKRKK